MGQPWAAGSDGVMYTKDGFGIETIWPTGTAFLLQRSPGEPWSRLEYASACDAADAFDYVDARKNYGKGLVPSEVVDDRGP